MSESKIREKSSYKAPISESHLFSVEAVCDF